MNTVREPMRFSAGRYLSTDIAGAGSSPGQLRLRRKNVPSRKKTRNPPKSSQDDMVTRRAICRWAAQPPVLDGKLDDRCWQKGAVIDHFASFWTKTPRAGLLPTWSGMTMPFTTPPRWPTPSFARSAPSGTTRSGRATSSSCSSSRVPTSPSTSSFRPILACWSSRWPLPRRGGDPLDFTTAPPLGSKAVVVLEGNARSARRSRHGLDRRGSHPLVGVRQRRRKTERRATSGSLRFAAMIMDRTEPRPVLMSSAPLTEPKFHRYEDYGKLRFEGPARHSRQRDKPDAERSLCVPASAQFLATAARPPGSAPAASRGPTRVAGAGRPLVGATRLASGRIRSHGARLRSSAATAGARPVRRHVLSSSFRTARISILRTHSRVTPEPAADLLQGQRRFAFQTIT